MSSLSAMAVPWLHHASRHFHLRRSSRPCYDDGDKCTGCFSEGRLRSVASLDETSLLAPLAYIDSNPIAAGLEGTPKRSPSTSILVRVDHCASNGRLDTLIRHLD